MEKSFGAGSGDGSRWAGGRRAPVLALLLYGLAMFVLRPATPFEWDEVLFQRGLDHYDVAMHSPHPPGYPAYIAAARVVRAVVGDPLLALQLVAIVAAMATVAFLWRIARRLGASEGAAWAACALAGATPAFLFNANVGLSDVPGTAATVAAVWFLVRSVETPRLLPVAAAVSALAVGVRPQLVVVLLPALAWTVWRAAHERRWGPLTLSFAVGLAVTAACWVPAVLITGPARFWGAVRKQSAWVEVTERGYHLPGAPLWEALGHWTIQPFGTPVAAIAFWTLVVWGTWTWLRRGGRRLAALAGVTALTYIAVALASMNYTTSVRYVLPALPFLALLASGGVADGPAFRRRAAVTVAVLWCAGSAAWTWPALRARLQPAPVWAALTWVREHFDPTATRVGYEGGIGPHVGYVLGRSGFRIGQIGSSPLLDEPAQPGERTLFVTALPVPGAKLLFDARFSRRLVNDLARGRYGTCAVSLIRAPHQAVFSPEWQIRRDGWHLMGTGRIRLPEGSTPALVRLCAGAEPVAVERPGAAAETLTPRRCALLPLLPGKAGEIAVSAPSHSPALLPPVQLLPVAALAPDARRASAYMVPQVAHIAGGGGSFWQTDLVVINPQPRPLRIAASFLPTETDNRAATRVSTTLAPGQILRAGDVLALAPFAGRGSLGAMLVAAAEPEQRCADGGCDFVVLARTYNTSAQETSWRPTEWLPGIPAAETVPLGGTATFGHVTNTDTLGASVGLASWSPAPVRVRIEVSGAAGGEPGSTATVTLAPFGHRRVEFVQRFADATLTVQPEAGPPGALVVPYLAIVDHRNGLPTYLLPDSLPVHPLPERAPPMPRAEGGS